jgi:hypothetical protein
MDNATSIGFVPARMARTDENEAMLGNTDTVARANARVQAYGGELRR